MTMNRGSELFPKDVITPQSIIETIQKLKSELQLQTRDALSGDTIEEAAKMSIFEKIWGYLTSKDVQGQFVTESNIDRLFKSYIDREGLCEHIKIYAVEMGLETIKIEDSIISLYLATIKLLHQSTLIYWRYKDLENSENYTERFTRVSKLNLLIEQMEELLKNVARDENYLDVTEFNAAMSLLAYELSLKRYGSIGVELPEKVDRQLIKNERLIELIELITSLPTIRELNSSIANYHEPKKVNEPKNDDDAVLPLKDYIPILTLAVDKITRTSFDMKDRVEPLKQVVQINNALNLKLANIVEIDTLLEAFSKIKSLREQDTNTIKALSNALSEYEASCKMQMNQFFDKSVSQERWLRPVVVIKKSVEAVTQQVDKFTEPYAATYQQLTLMKNKMAKMNLTNQKLLDARSKLIQSIELSYSKFDAAAQLINDVNIELIKHTETNIDYLRKFLKKNWGKLTIGGVGGASTTGLITVTMWALGYAINPFLAGALTAFSGVVGVGGGSGIGFWREAKNEKKTEQQEEIVVDVETNNNATPKKH